MMVRIPSCYRKPLNASPSAVVLERDAREHTIHNVKLSLVLATAEHEHSSSCRHQSTRRADIAHPDSRPSRKCQSEPMSFIAHLHLARR